MDQRQNPAEQAQLQLNTLIKMIGENVQYAPVQS